MPAEGLSAVTARITEIADRFLPAPAGFAQQLASALGASPVPASMEVAPSPVTGSGLLLGAWLGRPAPAAAPSQFVAEALSQIGDEYVFGAQVDLNDQDPTTFDCSELVRWAAHQSGVEMPDGSWLQYLEAKQRGLLIPVEVALRTPGALLFSFSSEPQPGAGRPVEAHVAISLGDGSTIEARGSSHGVGSFGAADRFQYAALVPGLRY